MNGWRTSFGIKYEVDDDHHYYRARERMGLRSLAVGAK
jgi:hypothetical protein